MKPETSKLPQPSAAILPGETVLTEAEIAELGLEEAPAGAGPSLEEIAAARMGRPGHG